MKIIYVFVLALLLPLVIGCGIQTTAVTGTVTQNAAALSDMTVLLQPVSSEIKAAEAAFGKTDEKGHFTLSLIQSRKSGVVPGEYSLMLNWNDPNPKPENEAPNPCPYDIPQTARDGSKRIVIEKQRNQTLNFELSEFAKP